VIEDLNDHLFKLYAFLSR